MDYLIVENRQTVHLGPMNWRQRRFQEEINDLEIEYTVPATEQGYIKVNDNLEIFPVSLAIPGYDPLFECLSGPFWEYENQTAVGTYIVQPLEIYYVKQSLIAITSAKRYEKEIGGTKVNIRGTDVSLDTSREGRNVFAQTYIHPSDGSTVNWKFPEAWIVLTKEELKSVIDTVNVYVQEQFTWEKNIVDAINSARTAEELKSIFELELNQTIINTELMV